MELLKQSAQHDEFVTVVSVGTEENNYENLQYETTPEQSTDSGFVTVLTIGDELPNHLTHQPSESVEEILVYRLPGERLGFGLKFEGGTKTTECVRRLFIQSCAPDSPASRVKCSWGSLCEGDEVLKIDNYSVKSMTRIDCVRSLKDSNVVIKLIVKHNNHSSKISLNSSFNSDDEFSGEEMEKRDIPPPPPIPPRKTKGNKDKIVPQPRDSVEKLDIKHCFPKSAPRTRLNTPPKVPVRDRKLSEPGSIPPDAEVYLDLLSQELELEMKTESESDDTGSTISTVIDRHNSNFITSNSSSIASDSVPSTPTAVQKQLDLTKVVNPFEMLELEYASNIKTNNDFLFTRFVTSHDILFETDLKTELEKNSLIPPANFQDAPLSYGNEDVANISQEETLELNREIDNSFEELDKREEELQIPKPVPRKCYAKKKEELRKVEDLELPAEIVDVNLPRLVNFLPKTKISPDLNPILLQDDDLNEDFLDDYMCQDTCEMIECNNNTCDKIISCSTWSLSSQLETIGEIEEETDSLDSKTERYDIADNIIADIKMSNEKYEIIDNFHNILVDEENDNIYPAILTTNNGDYSDKNGRFNYNTDNTKSIYSNNNSKIFDPIDMDSNNTAPCEEPDHEITVLNLTENGQNSKIIEEDMKSTIHCSEHIDQMDVSNFIQSEQNHTITTSEYSSLSSLSSPPLSFSSRVPSDGTDFSATEVENITHPPSLKHKAPQDKVAHMSLESQYSITESPTKQSNTRSSIWKKDEQSSKSIKDKIAIFSAENSEPLLPQEFSRVSKAFKSSENIAEDRTLGKCNNKISKSCANVDKCSLVESSLEITKNGTETCEETKTQVPTFTKPNLRLHTRSQSLLDMSSLDSPWNNTESRRLTLNSLIEQRRKGISKLRGLIIPQTDIAVEPVLDLPEIRSKEAEALSKMRIAPAERSKSDSMEHSNHQRSSLQSPSWKNNSITTSSLPRYSPAFKRKCLQVYVMEQSSNSSKHDDKIEDEVFSKNNFSENYSYKPQIRKTVTTDSNFDINHSLSSKDESNKLITPLLEAQRRPTILPRTKPDLDRVTDDSDNDSAVSSSQSSYNISRECSPLPSPLDYTNNLLTDHNGINGRVLKPQSVEAINRKNILASAKCRSGRDFKNGSPLIQRKLSGTEEEKVIIEECHEEESNLEYEGVSSDELDIKSISSSSSMTITEPAIVSEVKLVEQFTIIESDIQECTDECEPELPVTPPPKTEVSPPISEDSFINPLNSEFILPNTEVSLHSELTSPNSLEPYIEPLNLPLTPPDELYTHLLNMDGTSSEEKRLNTEETHIRPSKLPPKPSIPTVVLRSTVHKQAERPTSMLIPTSSRYDSSKRASVTDIRKQFEKFELENQKSPTSPEAKPVVAKKLNSPVKSTKILDEPKLLDIVTKAEVKMAKIPNGIVQISKEDLKLLINDFNEGLDGKNSLYINEVEVNEILVQREYSEGSIGITLTGGTDYEAKEITVHKVINGGCAHKDGRLKKGDRILSINGHRMLGITHKESIEILKNPQPEVTFIVVPVKENAKLPVSPQAKTNPELPHITNNTTTSTLPTTSSESKVHKVVLTKDGAGLGFSLDGGKDSPKGDKPLIIKKIFTGGSADKCGQLKAGDELLEVNEVEVHKMTRIEGWSLMKKLPDGKVTLTIRR